MKIKLTEAQFKRIEQYISESRVPPKSINLIDFFNKNKETSYFMVDNKQKDGQDNSYRFGVKFAGLGDFHITDLNKGTKTRGCSQNVRLNDFLYDDEVIFNCGGKRLMINKVTGIRLFDSNNQQLDQITFNNTTNVDADSLVQIYNDDLMDSNNGSQLFFDSTKKYDGIVYNKAADGFEVEFSEHGTNKESSLLLIDFNKVHFYEQNGNVMFSAIKKNVKTGAEIEFTIPIKRFTITGGGGRAKAATDDDEQPKDIKLDDKELKRQAKLAYDEILADKTLQQAFYKAPSLWNLFVAELTGKKAPGTGILPTLQIVRANRGKNLNNDLDATFIPRKWVEIKAYKNNIELNSFQIRTGDWDRRAYPKELELNAENQILINKRENFEIVIQSKTEKPNVYRCDLYHPMRTTGQSGNSDKLEGIYLEFNPASEGYNPIDNEEID